jgi:hypothetical protein
MWNEDNTRDACGILQTKTTETNQMLKPQLIINAQGKRKIQVVIKGGMVQDVVKQGCPDVDIEFRDYDNTFVFDEDQLSIDENGKEYHLTSF